MLMDLVGLPLTSIILFVLAGILIGHSFWYRDRSAEVERTNWLEKRYTQARSIARQRKQQLSSKTDDGDRKQYELGTLQQRYEANLVQLKQLQRSSQATAQELEAVRGQLHETNELLQGEQRRNDLLVNQMQEVLKDRNAREAEINTELDAVRDENASVAATLADRDFQLSNVQDQLEDLLPLRVESVRDSLTIAEQQQEIAALKGERTTASTVPAGSGTKTPSLDKPQDPTSRGSSLIGKAAPNESQPSNETQSSHEPRHAGPNHEPTPTATLPAVSGDGVPPASETDSRDAA